MYVLDIIYVYISYVPIYIYAVDIHATCQLGCVVSQFD